MKRQAAFENTGNKMLKGALHCHTTRSDGRGTPEEVIAKHVDHGYDFMALTDHRIYNKKNFGDRPMTILPGVELDSNFPEMHTRGVRCHHIVCIGPLEGNGYAQDQRFRRRNILRPEDTQPMLDDAHANGNMTIYCHPEWSGTPASQFRMLRGNFAMEIWNSGCAIENELDANAAYWDDLLAEGQRIWGVATDDGHRMEHHCLGWVRVNSENSVPAILEALKNGAFYSSCGPEIEDFYVENGVAHVRCSDAAEITMRQLCVPYDVVYAEEGRPLREASFRIRRGAGTMYVRAVVKDAQGRRAWSNPIFLEESDFPDPPAPRPES